MTDLLRLVVLLIVITLLNVLALNQKKSIFLNLLIPGADIVFGLYYAWQTDPFFGTAAEYSPTWVAGVIIAIFGGYMVVTRVIMRLLRG